MLKKIIFILFMVVLSTSVLASLELTKKTYGPNQFFEGDLIINETKVSLDEIIKGNVLECGSYSEKQISLFNLLTESGLYSGDLYSYNATGSAFTTISFDSGEEDYAFQITNTIQNFSFGVTGNSGKIKLDIGLDGYDWEYFGGFKGWGEQIHSLDFKNSYNTYSPNYVNVLNRTSKIERCSEFELEFGELQGDLLVRVDAVAKRITDTGGILKARIGSESCEFENVTGGWSTFSCSINLDVSDEVSPAKKKVCVYSTNDNNKGDFIIPEVPPDSNYYFITLNPPLYGDYETNFELTSSSLKTKINNYYNFNCNGLCTIPFRISGDGTFNINPVLVLGDGTISNLNYNLDIKTLEYNLSGEKIDLSYFDDLRVPSIPNNDCRLQIDFLGNQYLESFNVTDSPIPNIDSSFEFIAKGISITFDGSLSEGDIVSYKWNFGDGQNGSGKVTTHRYKTEGNFEVTLTVKDAKGVEESTTLSISVVSLEEVLDKEIPSKIKELNESISDFKNLGLVLKSFYDDMNFGSITINSLSSLEEIRDNFSSVKESTITQTKKESRYIGLFNDLSDLTKKTPKDLGRLNSSIHRNYAPISITDIQTFSRIEGISNLRDVKNKIYLFNQRNVKGDYNYYLIKVDYLSGVDKYVYVDKEFVSKEVGSLVENLESYKDVEIFTSGCELDGLGGRIYCSNVGNIFNLRYASLHDDIVFTSGYVVTDDVYDEVKTEYNPDCESGDCDYSYCGDNICDIFSGLGISEKDKDGSYYCPYDCGGRIPWKWFIGLGIFLILGIFWINFYRGPGNFFDMTNKISFKLFNKRLFLIKKDQIILRTYILRAVREGFNQGEIRRALQKKGWTKKQLDFVFNQLRQKSI